MIAYLQNGHAVEVSLGIVKEINQSTIVFSVGKDELSIAVSSYTLGIIRDMLDQTPLLMLPIHLETNSILMDVQVQESQLEELEGAMDVVDEL